MWCRVFEGTMEKFDYSWGLKHLWMFWGFTSAEMAASLDGHAARR